MTSLHMIHVTQMNKILGYLNYPTKKKSTKLIIKKFCLM